MHGFGVTEMTMFFGWDADKYLAYRKGLVTLQKTSDDFADMNRLHAVIDAKASALLTHVINNDSGVRVLL